MTFLFTYCQEGERLIPAVEISARSTNIALQAQPGSVIKAFTDSIYALVVPGTLLYKIETATGNLVGYFLLTVQGQTATITRMTLRMAFQQFGTQLLIQVNQFITNGIWQFDNP